MDMSNHENKNAIPMKGAEYDVHTAWRGVLCYLGRSGVTKKLKRQYNKRVRKQHKQELSRIV